MHEQIKPRFLTRQVTFNRLILPLVLLLGACAPMPDANTTSRAATPERATLPPIKTFSNPNPTPPARANSDIARDFLDLSFQLESGSTLPVLTRFESPITVRVTGAPPATLMPDLDRLLRRLRSEAGVNISRVSGAAANITIEAVSRRDIHRFQPSAACFVVPNVSSLKEYRATWRGKSTGWGEMRKRTRLAIFLPNDVSPQETRDCLHEELAQALGPLNDLYRLPDSIYNDDNMQTVLTGFDMLILRATYQPELHSGMTRQQVASRLPAILSRLNPHGDTLSPRHAKTTPRTWINAIETALGPGASQAKRMRAANRALEIATSEGWFDHRLGFTHYTLGRLAKNSNPALSVQHFNAAMKAYLQTPGTDIQQANTATQLAAWSINAGQPDVALKLVLPYVDTAMRHEDAALLANLMLLRAEALDMMGKKDSAQALRLDSLGWARYGFGTNWVLRSKLSKAPKIATLDTTNG